MVDAFHRAGIEVYPRRRLQPHRRRGRRRPDLQLPRRRQHALLHAGRTRPLPEFQRLRQHVQQRPPGGPQLPARLPAELGRGGGRRRFPVRPRLGAWAATGTAMCWSSRRSINRISEDSLLRDTKLIAEPWDAAGLYQVGTFPGEGRWSDWNGRYRDDVRRFWRGDPGMTSALATRLCGSDDLYNGRGPLHSINFICCHDGFTLERPGLLQPEAQRGQRRGEPRRQRRQLELELRRRRADRRPGRASRLRSRQVRNLIATLMVSQGVPDDPGRRRVPPHPARQQQRLVPGQRHRAGSTGRCGSGTPASSGSSR